MAGPTLAIEIAFASNPGDVPVWTDVTAYAQAFTVRRGRQRRADRFQAGGASVMLNNQDRRFEPEYGGAYYPNVLPMRRLRISAVWDATTYRLFAGFIVSWPPAYARKSLATVTVEAVDGFKVLAMKQINATYSQELSSTRVGNIADSAGWPAADRDIDTGQSTVQAVTAVNAAALQQMQNAEEAESGRLFIAGDGDLTFLDRHSLLQAPYNTSQATFGPAAGELPYSSLTFRFDDAEIWNELRYTRDGGTEQVATDATSQTTYLTRTLTKTGMIQTSDAEVLSEAQYHLSQFLAPHLGIQAIKLDPYRTTDLWPQVLGRDLAERVTVQFTPPGGGAEISQEVLLEGISHDVAVGSKWLTQWSLSAADTQNYWLLGDTVYSVLDTTTRLAY